MNIKLSSIAIALIATTASAFAAEPTLTRAQVRADVEQAYARGELNRQNEFVEHTGSLRATPRTAIQADRDRAFAQGGTATQSREFVEHGNIAGGKSRTEVRAELEQAYAHGQVGNQSEFVEHTQVATGKSRDAVRDDAIRAAEATRNARNSGS